MEPEIFQTQIEYEFLRTLIMNGDLIYEIKSEIAPDMLSSNAHQYIYRALESLADRNVGISREILLGELNDKKWLEKAGTASYLDDVILSGRPNVKGLKEHVRKIQSNYKKRALLEINSKIPGLVDGNENVDAVISKVNRDLDELVASAGISKKTVLVAEVIDGIVDDIKRRKENPALPGISSGFGNIDMYTAGLMPGDIWYIAARPSMGKTTWVLKALLNIAMQGIPCLLFSQEMSQRALNERLISMIAEVDHQKIRLGRISDDDFSKIEEAKELLKTIPLYIDSSFFITVDEIVAIIRKHHQLYGIKVVGIDYIQLIVDRGGDATAELGRASRLLKLISNELSITTVIISQLNRDVEKRDNKRPLMSDMRQSGNLEEDADIMAALYRDEVYVENSPDAGKMEFIIRKARNGPIGTIILNFNKETVNLYDAVMYDWMRND